MRLAPQPAPPLRGLVSMPMAAYHEHPALGRSTLDKIIDSPKALQHYLQHGAPDTAAYLQGRVLHSLFLEPTEFWKRVTVWKGGDKVKHAGEWKKFKAEAAAAGRDPIDQWQFEIYQEIEAAFFSNPRTRHLLQGALIEQVAFFERQGVACKARPDAIQDASGHLYDLKFMSDVSPSEFFWAAKKFGYHRQAAWYLDAVTQATGRFYDKFTFLVMPKPPKEKPKAKMQIEAVVYECDADFIARGRAENDLHFGQYLRCLKRSVWPGHGDKVHTLRWEP